MTLAVFAVIVRDLGIAFATVVYGLHLLSVV